MAVNPKDNLKMTIELRKPDLPWGEFWEDVVNCHQDSPLTIGDAYRLGSLLVERFATVGMPVVWWEYVGEELAIFWNSPYGHGKEKIATFWWPIHPAEATAEVEATFERIAARLSTPKSDPMVPEE